MRGGNVSLSHEDLAWFGTQFEAVTANIERAIQGKRPTIDLVVSSLVAEGHVLIEDVPGVGKTLLAKALARSIDCSFQRIQFTPDLLPTDVTGVSVWDRERNTFTFRPGPVFGNVVLGDEINRASPKTQAALLEAMEERQVTIDGETHALAEPFIVIATQNPIEHEGTYPLPEAQLDRFMVRLTMGYPERSKELEMLQTHGSTSSFNDLKAVVHAEDIVRMSSIARQVHVADVLRGYLIDVAEATRSHPDILLGASPRATLFLQRASRAIAAAAGRDYASPDDVKVIISPVLNHRLIVRPEAQMRGVTVGDVLEEVVASVPVPGTRVAP
jgi:MoxR-like ATPase